jgi:hypothetical protein
MVFYREMLLFIFDNNIRHHCQFNRIAVVGWRVVIDQRTNNFGFQNHILVFPVKVKVVKLVFQTPKHDFDQIDNNNQNRHPKSVHRTRPDALDEQRDEMPWHFWREEVIRQEQKVAS